MNINELRDKMYSRVIENRDFGKIDKMINGIEAGKINKENLLEMFTVTILWVDGNVYQNIYIIYYNKFMGVIIC